MNLPKPLLLALLPLALLTACAGVPQKSTSLAESGAAKASKSHEADEKDDVVLAATSGVKYQVIPEAFLSSSTPEANVDSPASWQGPDGETLVFASAKASDEILIYNGDTGELLRKFGEPGAALGQLSRPNGVFVVDNLLFVVERDNHRVQVFGLPEMKPIGFFGQRELIAPYGLWVRKIRAYYEVMVSDGYMAGEDKHGDGIIPPPAQLNERFKRYLVGAFENEVQANRLDSFGSTDPKGAIKVPESLWGDEIFGRMLIAEEEKSSGTRLKEYSLADFSYTGRDVGAELFKAQAEGIALWHCRDGSGYWIAADQFKDHTVFHIFERTSLEHLGAFAGNTTGNTDGVWLNQSPTKAFPAGVFYAVHDDQALAAFDWRDIAKAFGLTEICKLK